MIIAKVQFDKMVLIAYLEDMTSQDTLPERLLPQCLDILRKLSSGERDLIRVVVEIIHDLRDVDKDDDELVCAVQQSN